MRDNQQRIRDKAWQLEIDFKILLVMYRDIPTDKLTKEVYESVMETLSIHSQPQTGSE